MWSKRSCINFLPTSNPTLLRASIIVPFKKNSMTHNIGNSIKHKILKHICIDIIANIVNTSNQYHYENVIFCRRRQITGALYNGCSIICIWIDRWWRWRWCPWWLHIDWTNWCCLIIFYRLNWLIESNFKMYPIKKICNRSIISCRFLWCLTIFYVCWLIYGCE
jgi:hypothetical protein